MIAYPLAWPSWAGIAPGGESWVPGNTDRGGGPGITGTEQTVGSPRSPWRAKLTLRLFRDQIVPFRGFVIALRGRAGTFRVGPFNLYGQPQPGTNHAGLVKMGIAPQYQAGPPFGLSPNGALAATALMLAREVQITLAGSRRPSPGNYLGLGDGLHIVTTVAGAGPTFTCGIEPGLRADTGAGAAVIFDRPLCLMKQFTPLDPGGLTVSAETMTTDVTLDLVEAF